MDLKTGVCQDHAHVFIAAARQMGFPARYVPLPAHARQPGTDGEPRLGRSHVDSLGWVGFDAANDICPNEDYVRVRCGLDYKDACPISA